MFPSLSAVRVFRIVKLMRTANRQSNYDYVGHNVHENAVVILNVVFYRICVRFYKY